MTEANKQFDLEAVKAAIQTGVAEQIEAATKELRDDLTEQKNLYADLEAKGQKVVDAPTNGEVKFDEQALNVKLREFFANAKDGAKNFEAIDTKALAVGGTGGEALAIDEELGRRVIERARENVVILQLIGRKSVSSTDYREMVLRGYPATAGQSENIAGSSVVWAETGTQTYEQVVMKVAKQYAKPFISDEAIADPHIDLMGHLEVLLAEEMSRYWAVQVIQGDGSTDNLRGILSSGRVESVESRKDNDTRNFNFYPIVPTDVDGALAADAGGIMDHLIDLTIALPTQYQAGASFTMNRRTLGVLRKLKVGGENSIGSGQSSSQDLRPLIQFEEGGFTVVGFPINIEDYWPNIATNSTPICFGQLSKAYMLIDIDDKFLLDPYSVDGGVLLKHTSRKGEMVQHNDAIVLSYCNV